VSGTYSTNHQEPFFIFGLCPELKQVWIFPKCLGVMKIYPMFFQVGTALPFIELKRKREYKLFLFYSPCKTKPSLGNNLVASATYASESTVLAALPNCWSNVANGARSFVASSR